jgi:hypothetical protein
LLGPSQLEPESDLQPLIRRLRLAMRHPDLVELIFFGSVARGSRTGFSDIDAMLVVSDRAGADPATLRALRRHVLAMERAILRFQPMQHHGLEVVTPSLLRRSGEALGMPQVAMLETRSLGGNQVESSFEGPNPGAALTSLGSLVNSTQRLEEWPDHPWHAHRMISMFELIPAVFLQATGDPTPKHESFGIAASQFRDWWPYDRLRQVREAWPRKAAPILAAVASTTRNPWVAHSAWRQTPMPWRPPQELDVECLDALQQLGRRMLTRATAKP